MQIPSVPPPIVTNSLPQDVVARAVPNVQAAAPLLPNAIAPTLKGEKSNQSRSNKDKNRDQTQKEEDGKSSDSDDHSVNIRV